MRKLTEQQVGAVNDAIEWTTAEIGTLVHFNTGGTGLVISQLLAKLIRTYDELTESPLPRRPSGNTSQSLAP